MQRAEDQNNQNNILADDNQSIRELTDVFRPLKTSEYIESQVKNAQAFSEQYKKTLESLKVEEKKEPNAPQAASNANLF